jgi:hypothetical protein
MSLLYVETGRIGYLLFLVCSRWQGGCEFEIHETGNLGLTQAFEKEFNFQES